MKEFGYPVIYDATHSVRKLGIPSDDPQGGDKIFIPHLVKAAVAVGCDALFIECHLDPKKALCDACTQIHIGHLEDILKDAIIIHETIRKYNMDQTMIGDK